MKQQLADILLNILNMDVAISAETKQEIFDLATGEKEAGKSSPGLLLNGREAAQLLGVSRPTFYQIVKSGDIKPIVLNGMKAPRYNRNEIATLVNKK
jgi:excisionase family DNA binding protein